MYKFKDKKDEEAEKLNKSDNDSIIDPKSFAKVFYLSIKHISSALWRTK